MPLGEGDHPKHDFGQVVKSLDVLLDEASMFRAIGLGDETGLFGGPYEPDPAKVAQADADGEVFQRYRQVNITAHDETPVHRDDAAPEVDPEP